MFCLLPVQEPPLGQQAHWMQRQEPGWPFWLVLEWVQQKR
jgi:hypothetical protein